MTDSHTTLSHALRSDFTKDLAQARQIILRGLAPYRAEVYLYGSVAQGRGRRTSDIDIAVWSEEPLPQGTLAAIRQEIEESNIPYPVELVNLQGADETFRERVVQEGILWSVP